MTEHIELTPFFEREEGSPRDFLAEAYVAGFRHTDGKAAVELKLPAETVERTVLAGARLSLWLAFDGHLVLEGEGLSDQVLEVASAAGELSRQTLTSLVTTSLDPVNLAGEDNPVAELTSLRAQLSEALAQVDGAIDRLKMG
jgi:hypothetical protein